MKPESVGLYDLLKAVRDELKRFKDEQGGKKDIGLLLDSLELELKALVSAEGGAGIKLIFAQLGGKIKMQDASVIRLSFKQLSEKARPRKNQELPTMTLAPPRRKSSTLTPRVARAQKVTPARAIGGRIGMPRVKMKMKPARR